MSTIAIVSRRHSLHERARTAEPLRPSDLVKSGVKVTHLLPQGLCVSGTLKELQALEAAGLRVNILTGLHEIMIGKHRIDILKPRPRTSAGLDVPKEQQIKWSHHLIQLAAPAHPEWIAALQNLGITVVERVSRYAYFVTCAPEVLGNARRLDFVSWAGPFLPAYRMAPGFEKTKGTVKYLSVGILGEENVDSVRATLQKMGGCIALEEPPDMFTNPHYHTILAEVDAKAIRVLARHPNVRWLSSEGVAKVCDERSAQIISGDLNGAAPPNTAPNAGYLARLAELGLTGGAGVTIAICDSGIDTNINATLHPDLAGRMAFFVDKTSGGVPTDTDGHGTHVAGIAVGAGVGTGDVDPQGFLLGQGVAPAASFGSINPVGNVGFNITAISQDAVTHGATLQNNSWEFPTGGVSAPNSGYDNTCRFADIRVRDANNPATAALDQLVHVFAAGNSGPAPNTIVRPHEAKNIIVVGDSLNHRPGELASNDDIRGISNGSSRGPCLDGRLAPHVVAPGTSIVSTRSTASVPPNSTYTDTGATVHASHTVKNGTSMAAPHITGLCALLVEWWKARTGGLHPSAALLKAMLVNGAVDLAGGSDGNAGILTNIPNNDQGWGRANLENMLLQTSDRGPKILFDRDLAAFTVSGQTLEIQIGVVDTSKPLRITLAWTDASGATDANPALVNDLDLEVQEILPGDVLGQLFLGNVFVNGFSAVGGAADTLNNLECVYLQSPTTRYVVRIIATSLLADARLPTGGALWQDFAFVIDNAIRVNIDNPVSVVPVIDRSGSMVGAGYVDVTRTTSKNFIDLLQVNDAVGVVSFGATGAVEFSDGAGGLVAITGDVERTNAKNAVDAVIFGGCTFMGDGINQARDLLAGATTERAIVLMSDGFDNKGCDAGNPAKPSALDATATLPAGLPIYACAMGPASDQVLLEQLAATTGGRYYFMPAIEDLGEIYNYIHGQVAGEDESIITNASLFASKSRMNSFVDAAATRVTFSVMWYDKTLKYSAQESKKEDVIHVRLYDPRGKRLHPLSTLVHTIVGEGYVVFRMDEPAAGKWVIEVETSRAEHTRYTVGGFVRSRLRLRLPRLPQVIKAGGWFQPVVQVLDGDSIVLQVRTHARVNAPVLGLDDLLRQYKPQWTRQNLGGNYKDVLPSNLSKFMAYRDRILKTTGKDLVQRMEQTVLTQHVSDAAILTSRAISGAAHLVRLRTMTPGSHNLRLTVTGFSPEHNTKFVRQDQVSVVVV